MLPPPPLGGNKIKLLGKKVKWGRREKGEGRRKGKKERGREEGKGKQRGKKEMGRDWKKGKGREGEGKREEFCYFLIRVASSLFFPSLLFPFTFVVYSLPSFPFPSSSLDFLFLGFGLLPHLIVFPFPFKLVPNVFCAILKVWCLFDTLCFELVSQFYLHNPNSFLFT